MMGYHNSGPFSPAVMIAEKLNFSFRKTSYKKHSNKFEYFSHHIEF